MHSQLTWNWDLLLRILVGTALGAIIGYERDVHGRPAGLRTHALVALASSTFMVVSTHFVYFQHYGKEDLIAVDASRIAASVVSGIGFLAGGAILRTGLSVQGLTTAAGLWLVAAIGLATGGGMYLVGTFATALGVLALTLLWRFEDKQIINRRMSIALDGDPARMSAILARLKQLGATVSQLDYENQIAEVKLAVTFDIRIPSGRDPQAVVELVEAEAGVKRVRLWSAV
jgi:putative Mg2+ transporter-C (MgtC) family protein